MHLMQRNIAAWTLSFLRRHSLSTHEKPRSRRCKTVETDGLRGCTASLAWWLCRGRWNEAHGRGRLLCIAVAAVVGQKIFLTYVYQKFTGGLNLYLTVPNSDVRSLLRSLGLHRQVIEAFELLNLKHFRHFFLLSDKAKKIPNLCISKILNLPGGWICIWQFQIQMSARCFEAWIT